MGTYQLATKEFHMVFLIKINKVVIIFEILNKIVDDGVYKMM